MLEKFVVDKMKEFGFRYSSFPGSNDFCYGKQEYPFCTIFRLNKIDGIGYVEINMEDPWNKESEIDVNKLIDILVFMKEAGYTKISGMS